MNQMNVDAMILKENRMIIVINKLPGIPVQDDKTGDLSILSLITKARDNRTLYLYNRLDRPVSGIVILAKSKKALHLLENDDITKVYTAIVPPGIEDEQTLTHYLKKDGRHNKARISDEPRDGYKKCILNYKKVKSLDNYDVIEVKTESGRFHQIRCQLAHNKYPIKGDVKYGARRKNRDRSIDLHATRVVIPTLELDIEAPINRTDPIWQSIV